MSAGEFNFDGLVGPTHNYAGLSLGNIASINNAANNSSPRKAALQGLEKMKQLADLGIPQAVLPPQERPAVYALRRLGFSGDDAQIISKVSQKHPELFNACCSASSMWTANAATVSPSADCADDKTHFTPANLSNKFHRSIEAETTSRILGSIFQDQKHFAHHEPLPAGEHFSDEGAANHTRLCNRYAETGVEFFVWGRSAFDNSQTQPKKFPARQTLEASQAISRAHELNPDKTVFAQQNPAVIDCGVFHNDVIAVGNQQVLFYHQKAFANSDNVLAELNLKLDGGLCAIEVPDGAVSVTATVSSYLFNSQLVTLGDQSMALIAPSECSEAPDVAAYLGSLLADSANPINKIYYMDVRESMRNGGGPACLRLRVVLSTQEQAAIKANVVFDNKLYDGLVAWVNKHYRDRLNSTDLADPKLLIESRQALDELTQILNLGSVYPFQLSPK